jgi:hypothetical protein
MFTPASKLASNPSVENPQELSSETRINSGGRGAQRLGVTQSRERTRTHEAAPSKIAIGKKNQTKEQQTHQQAQQESPTQKTKAHHSRTHSTVKSNASRSCTQTGPVVMSEEAIKTDSTPAVMRIAEGEDSCRDPPAQIKPAALLTDLLLLHKTILAKFLEEDRSRYLLASDFPQPHDYYLPFHGGNTARVLALLGVYDYGGTGSPYLASVQYRTIFEGKSAKGTLFSLPAGLLASVRLPLQCFHTPEKITIGALHEDIKNLDLVDNQELFLLYCLLDGAHPMTVPSTTIRTVCCPAGITIPREVANLAARHFDSLALLSGAFPDSLGVKPNMIPLWLCSLNSGLCQRGCCWMTAKDYHTVLVNLQLLGVPVPAHPVPMSPELFDLMVDLKAVPHGSTFTGFHRTESDVDMVSTLSHQDLLSDQRLEPYVVEGMGVLCFRVVDCRSHGVAEVFHAATVPNTVTALAAETTLTLYPFLQLFPTVRHIKPREVWDVQTGLRDFCAFFYPAGVTNLPGIEKVEYLSHELVFAANFDIPHCPPSSTEVSPWTAENEASALVAAKLKRNALPQPFDGDYNTHNVGAHILGNQPAVVCVGEGVYILRESGAPDFSFDTLNKDKNQEYLQKVRQGSEKEKRLFQRMSLAHNNPPRTYDRVELTLNKSTKQYEYSTECPRKFLSAQRAA